MRFSPLFAGPLAEASAALIKESEVGRALSLDEVNKIIRCIERRIPSEQRPASVRRRGKRLSASNHGLRKGDRRRNGAQALGCRWTDCVGHCWHRTGCGGKTVR
jgi:hypothetical protein